MSHRDLWSDGNGRPLIGTPLGRRQFTLSGIVARETFRRGKLIGWQGRHAESPVLEYPNGEREVLESLAETDWRR